MKKCSIPIKPHIKLMPDHSNIVTDEPKSISFLQSRGMRMVEEKMIRLILRIRLKQHLAE